MRRLAFLLTLTLAACAPSDPPPPAPETLLEDAAAYLWSQQGEDGGWHSTTHGLLRGGQAWTPFVLHALLQVPEDIYARPEGGVDRALAFLRAHIDSTGALGFAVEPALEYPNYATAYALRVFTEVGAPEDSALVRRVAAYLQSQQFTEGRGFVPDDPEYGAWGFGETGLSEGEAGHLDLSHTRRVLQALRAADAVTPEAEAAAARFLRFLQKHPESTRPQPPSGTPSDSAQYDGGFYASPTVYDTNKGRLTERGVFRSYATTTAEGILALLATGHAPESEPVQDAARWLVRHPDWTTPAGIPTDDPDQWHRVMRLYHIATQAEALDRLGTLAPHRDSVMSALVNFRRADGSFANPEGAPNKEDDPLLATALAVEALARLVG